MQPGLCPQPQAWLLQSHLWFCSELLCLPELLETPRSPFPPTGLRPEASCGLAHRPALTDGRRGNPHGGHLCKQWGVGVREKKRLCCSLVTWCILQGLLCVWLSPPVHPIPLPKDPALWTSGLGGPQGLTE